MELNNSLGLNQTLSEIEISQPGFSFNEEAIQKELKERSAVYSGLGIKILSVVGGILGTGFFLGFLFMAVFNRNTISWPLGLIFIIASFFINKLSKSIILDTSTICVYLSGYILMYMGLDELDIDDNFLIGTILLISLLSIFLTRSFMLVFLSVLIFNGSLLALIENNRLPDLIHVLSIYITGGFLVLTLLEHRIVSSKTPISKIYNPLRSAFLFSLIAFLQIFSADLFDHNHPLRHIWVSSIIFITAIILILNMVFNSLGITKPLINKFGYLFLSTVILLPGVFAPGIPGSLLIVLISYHYGHRTGFVSGLLALIYFIGRYYYDLNYTLLVKSGILMLSGVLFISAFLLVKKRLTPKSSTLNTL